MTDQAVTREDLLAAISRAKAQDEELLFRCLPNPLTIDEILEEGFGGRIPDAETVTMTMGIWVGILAERQKVDREVEALTGGGS